MSRPEVLRDLTESYLQAVIREVADAVDSDFDPAVPFKELGIDSFRVLKILRRLEEDFGSLPKTLLFENVNIDDLTRYFVARHEQTLERMFAAQLKGAEAAADELRAAP
jgi:polyketide synthase PksN